MKLSDLIIEHGPYVAGDPLPGWMRHVRHTEALNALREELMAARAVREVLDALVDTDPCENFDHHGQCQTHFTGTVDGKCAHAVAKELLAELNQRAGEHAQVCR